LTTPASLLAGCGAHPASHNESPILRSASARSRMKTTRLEAFSDGVLAILITIMVLELKGPHPVGLAELNPLLPVLLSYVLSFIYIGIYWNNHHHLFQATEQVS